MKSIVTYVIIGILLFSGFEIAVIAGNNYDRFNIKNEIISISEPIINELEDYQSIYLRESTSYQQVTGEPIMPKVSKIFVLPFGSNIKEINVKYNGENTLFLSKEIIPCSEPIPLNNEMNINDEIKKNIQIYEGKNPYPTEIFSYTTGAGLNNEEHVIYLNVECYPVRYLPRDKTLIYCDSIDISITYEKSIDPISFPDEYDLVIIAPSEFEQSLEPLVEHKNQLDIKTVLKTTEEIYSEFSGIDKPEQIKYFIKDALDNWGIKYVLLVGGLNSLIDAIRRDDQNQGSTDWLVPVRYTNLMSAGGGHDDPGYISDLYYADIYDSEGNFSSWDTNEDGIYAGWRMGAQRDILDLYPDVYIGRLACRNTDEVETLVNKIITYESTPIDESWFKKIVLIGGDTFDDVSSNNYYEGEIENQKAIDYLGDFEPVKLWASNRDIGGPVCEPDDIISGVSEGSGFLFFAGHGSPALWETHWAGGPFDKDERTSALVWWHMSKFTNGEKLPISVVGGCHNSQFNVTVLTFLDYWFTQIADITGLEMFERPPVNVWFPTPECFSWYLTRVSRGGSIATIGNTGIGYGRVGNSGDLDGDGVDEADCVEALGGYIETLFFKMYGVEGFDILGETWGQAVTSYLNVYPGMKGQSDCKTVQQWILEVFHHW